MSTAVCYAPLADVVRWLGIFVRPGQVTELRALGVPESGRRVAVNGYFDHEHLEEMARHALNLSRSATGVYFVPNPIDPARMTIRPNRIGVMGQGEGTKDTDIVLRRWLMVDVDPQRMDKSTPSTGPEKQAAWEVALRVAAWFDSMFFRGGMFADSGNGWHVLYPLQAENHPRVNDALKRALRDLRWRCSSQGAEVDTNTYNPSRMLKVYGTPSRKGVASEERPHRATGLFPDLGPTEYRQPLGRGEEPGVISEPLLWRMLWVMETQETQ